MRYIFLFAALVNFWGGINNLIFYNKTAQIYHFPIGNIWETLNFGGIAIVFGIIYLSFFIHRATKDMYYLIIIFAIGKFWICISCIISYYYFNMPLLLAIIMGGTDLLIGILFIFYVFYYRNKSIVG